MFDRTNGFVRSAAEVISILSDFIANPYSVYPSSPSLGMETTINISFALSPNRPSVALDRPAKASDHPIPYAQCTLLAHPEAKLYQQLVAGWQFNMHLFTADATRGQTMRLQLNTSQVFFAYQLSGRIHRLLYDGAPFRLEKGQYCGCYLPAGDYLFNLPPGQHETLLVVFPYGYLLWLIRQHGHLQPLINAWKNKAGRVLCLPEAKIQQDERRTLLRIQRCPKRGDELDGALKIYLARLLALYNERLQQRPSRQPVEAMLDAVQAFMEAHYAERRPMRLIAIARQFGCSVSTLRHAYATKHGVTIATAVNRLRIHAAKQLLRDTDLPLIAIAEQVGFMYAESLIRAFKRETGSTPTAFRQQS